MRELLLDRVTSCILDDATHQRQHVADVVWALGKMRVDLRTLKPGFVRSLSHAVVAVAAAGDADDGDCGLTMARLAYGLCQVGVRWHAHGRGGLSDDAQRALVAALARDWDLARGRGGPSEQSLVNTVYALGKMEFPLAAAIPAAAQRDLWRQVQRVAPVMGPAAVGNVVWALGKMRARWADLPPALRRRNRAHQAAASSCRHRA